MDDRKHINNGAHSRAAGVIWIGCAVAARLACNAMLQHMQRSESFRARPCTSARVGRVNPRRHFKNRPTACCSMPNPSSALARHGCAAAEELGLEAALQVKAGRIKR